MRKVDKVKKRAEILEGALLVFAEKGYRKTKMSDIADRVGIGKATIYEYFRNKEDLFFSLIELLEARTIQLLEDIVNSTEHVEVKLKKVINSLFELYVQGENAFRVLVMFWTEHLRKGETESLRKKLQEFYDAIMNAIIETYNEGIKLGKFKEVLPDKGFARAVIAMIDGLAFQWILSEKEFNLLALGDRCSEFILNSIVLESRVEGRNGQKEK